jgi:hypothetical protein
VINTPIIDATRFIGGRADAKTVERTKRAFRRGHSPDQVAADILDGVRRDKAIVTSGWEATFGLWMHRLAPTRVAQLIARANG